MDTSTFKVYNASAGSGKTFRLVAEYLKILFKSSQPYEFQKILAITFTNKAAGEMKERILNTLRDASKEIENPIIQEIQKNLKLSDDFITIRSKKVLDNILYNYASFNVTTIDSFTHKLIRTFAHDLGLSLDFEVEMDIDNLFNEVVDLLITKIGTEKTLTDTLIKYTQLQIEDDKTWNISFTLQDIAKLLIGDQDQLYIEHLMELKPEDYQKLEKKLRKFTIDFEDQLKQIGRDAVDFIIGNDIAFNSFTQSGELPKFFDKLKKGELSTIKFDGRANTNVEKQNFYKKSKLNPQETIDQPKIDGISDELTRLFLEAKHLFTEQAKDYYLAKQVLKTLLPLSALNYLNRELQTIKQQDNKLFIAEFNRIISSEIKNEPVPYIFERLGEKYQYFFIDEMQDTSTLQWENLFPLIHNALAQEDAQLVLVGDAKQAIYRWRGGEADQFIALSNPDFLDQFNTPKSIETLGTNYRSYSEVINFNNGFFEFIAERLYQEDYTKIYAQEKHQNTNNKTGGYVEVELLPFDKNEKDKEDIKTDILEKIYQKIIESQQNGFKNEEICVLTRKKGHGEEVANYLMEHNINVISPDSLLLKKNEHIIAIINILTWIENPEDKNALFGLLIYLHKKNDIKTPKHDFLSGINTIETPNHLAEYVNKTFSITQFYELTLYDGIEYLLRAFDLIENAGIFTQYFLEIVLNFQLKNKGNLSSFLTYWTLKQDKFNIELSAAENAVQIMTIHKSKGLEFPVIIFPFDLNTEYINENHWTRVNNTSLFDPFPFVQLSVSKNLANMTSDGDVIYNHVNQQTQLDNFNLLYVALTRSVEQLYIISDITGKSNKNYSHLYWDYIKQLNQTEAYKYSSGDPKRLSAFEAKEKPYELKQIVSTEKSESNIQIIYNNLNEFQEYGNLIHTALEKIISIDDYDLACQYIDHQNLEKSIKNKAKAEIKAVINHPELSQYYQKGLIIINERNMVTQNQELLICDRLIFEGNNVTILDYKTGEFTKKHEHQIKQYAQNLEEMGYHVIKKILIYINKNIEVQHI